MSQNQPAPNPFLLGLLSLSVLVCAVLASGAPTVAVVSQAKTENPSHPEAQVRKQAQAFYNLMQASQYSDAEAYVLPDTRQNLRNQSKGTFMSYDIKAIKIDSSATPQTATVTTMFQVLRPPLPMAMPVSVTTTWVLTDNVWLLRVPKPLSSEVAQQLMSQPPPPPPPDDLNIAVEDRSLNLGTITVGQKPRRIVQFTNISDHPVSVEVETFCSCLTVENSKKIYQPKETGQLVLVFDPGEDRGDYAQTIVLRTSPGGGESHLLVRAYITPTNASPAAVPKGTN
jgi:hypothetical protein